MNNLLPRLLRRLATNTAFWQTATWLACRISLPMIIGLLLGVAGFVRDIQTAENNPPRVWEYILASYLAIAKWQLGYWISLALYVGVTMILVRRAFREEALSP